MNKFLSSFTNTYESRRPEIFLKKKEENRRSSPQLSVDELSSSEQETFQSWWRDLDPFNIGICSNKSIFQFISAFGLPDTALEQIFSLFQDQKDEISRQHFFAILRLISHAQNGRSITRDIVSLGAPLPKIRKMNNTGAAVAPSWMNDGSKSSLLPFAQLDSNNSNSKKVSHHRSKSAPQNKLTSIMTPELEYDESPVIYSKDDQYTGQDLLLTKSFKPEVDSKSYNPYYNQSNLKNTNCNSEQVPPPPVPPQSTKPAYPKYSRREPIISK